MSDNSRVFEFHIKPDELVQHFKNRSAYHDKRAAEKESHIPDLQKASDAMDEGRSIISNKASYGGDLKSQIRELERDVLHHKKSADKFLWLADHVPTHLDFQSVSVDELNRFEFF